MREVRTREPARVDPVRIGARARAEPKQDKRAKTARRRAPMQPAIDRFRSTEGLVTLRRLRDIVRPLRYRVLWAAVSVAFVVASLFIGQMLAVFPPGTTDLTPQLFVFLDPSLVGNNPYLVPSMIWTEPTFVLTLAFWPTVVMALLGTGVGLAASVTVRLFIAERRRRADLLASGAVPAVTGVGLLGACCCLTCAQTAALGAVAVALGSSPAVFFVRSWPIGLFQLVVLGLSLLYLERQVARPAPSPSAAPVARRGRWAVALATVLRLALLIGGMTWLLALVLELAQSVAPIPPALVYHWTFEHGLLGGLGVLAGLAPESLLRAVVRAAGSLRLAAGRVALAVAAVTWGFWVPPALVRSGLGGFLNELFGFLGWSPAWGAEAREAALGPALYFHWLFQHELLALFALAVAIRPRAVLAVLGANAPVGALMSSATATGGPAPVSVAGPEAASLGK
jgi:hypothetical protein